jgi:putative salt-induced outer membrane protein YdiY
VRGSRVIELTRVSRLGARRYLARGRFLRAIAVLSVLVIGMPMGLAAQEFIIHANGDSINGDIEGFKRGKLKFKIRGGSSSTIKYEEIVTFGSPDTWDTELTGNRRVLGSFLPSTDPGHVRVVTARDTLRLPISEIVEMTGVKNAFWSRFGGFVELGFQYAKANNAVAFNFAARADYRSDKWASALHLDSRLQDQDDAEGFRRNQGTLELYRLLPGNWGVGAFSQLEQNQQLDLDLRLLLGLVGGRNFLKTNRVDWQWALGLLSNREEFTGLEANTSAEALLSTRFHWFTYGDLENDLETSLLVYPSLTESGRVRIDFDVSYRQDLFGDLYFRLSFYDQFDSKPPEGANENDLGTTLALGWSL